MDFVKNLLQIPVKMVWVAQDLSKEAMEAFTQLGDALKGVLSKDTYDAIVNAIKKASGERVEVEVEIKEDEKDSTPGGEQGRSTSGGGGRPGPEAPREEEDSKPPESQKKKEEDSKDSKTARNVALVRSAIHTSSNIIGTSLKKGFGIVEDIYGRLKSASPLLQAIESMFNLAMQLFFMPLGNKLAEVLIPSVLRLVDDVVKIWDSFEGKSLGEMFDFAIAQAGKLFGGFFSNIGEALIEQGGKISSIGKLLQTIGNFIENNGAKVIETILGVVTSLIFNFKHFVSLWFSLKMTEVAMSAAGLFGDLGWNGVIAAIGVGAAAGLASEIGLTAAGFSEGGYIPETPGGKIVRVSEGGEGEYIVPESKIQTFIESHGGANLTNILNKVDENKNHQSLTTIGGDVLNARSESSLRNATVNKIETTKQSQTFNITYHINGYTDSELQSIIRTTVDEQVAKASYRS